MKPLSRSTSQSLSLALRIHLLSVLALAGLLIVLGLSLLKLNSVMQDDIADRTRKTVEVAHSTVAHYQALEQQGLLSREQAQASALATLQAMRYGANDYFWVHDMQPRMLMHPFSSQLVGKDIGGNTDADGVLMFQEMNRVVRQSGEGFVHYQWAKPNQDGASPKVSYVKGFAPWGWVVGSGVYTDQIMAAVGRAALQLGGLALLVAALMAGAGWALGRSITQPIGAMARRMRTLADGDKTSSIPGSGRPDEIGAMASALAAFRDAAVANDALKVEQQTSTAESAHAIGGLKTALDYLAKGDLTYRITEEFAPKAAVLKVNYNTALDRLQQAVTVVTSNVAAIRSGAGEISQASDDLSKRTEQQAASLEETAAALDQITATVARTAAGANQASELVGAARSDADKSGEIVRTAVDAMSAIERSSSEISNIIGVIDEIAFQTNLLALNAGVEAARAGDAGRGFAVVASEVRALAQRSAEAAKEIKTLISASSQQVEQGVELVGQAGDSLNRIANRVAEINGLVTEIAASAQEQATGLHQINTAVNQMDQVTQQNAAMVEEATAASHSLAQEAEVLAGSVARFDIGQPKTAHAAPARAAAPSPVRAPAPARTTARPAAPSLSPRTVAAMKTVGSGGAALKPAEIEDGWEEF